MLMLVLKFIGVIFLMFILDAFWAQYIKHTTDLNSGKSASYATLIYLLGCLVTISYIEDHIMILAAAIGSFAGTYTICEYNKKQTEKQKEKEKINK
jgi:lipid-A-disaccharide synthase-like uncharacterized protein